jgi:hypothetical protein
LEQAYKNRQILSHHKNDLKLFIDYAGKNAIRLIAVVFPFPADIEKTYDRSFARFARMVMEKSGKKK